MKTFSFLVFIISGFFYNKLSAQKANLLAVYDVERYVVKLSWNMVNSNEKTGYILLKSTDGVEWTEAAKDKRLRYYSEDDLYIFNDRNASAAKIYYRLKVFDSYNRTVHLSPIVSITTAVATVKNNSGEKIKSVASQPSNNNQPNTNSSNTWVVYPNPVKDVLTLSYKGREDLKGVVNVQVQDGTGKIVVKFRSASLYKIIQVPVAKLVRGIYFVQITVLNEVMLSRQFVKQ